ncbi:THO complex subunitTHOC2 C-terminal domain-containing protein [Entamoeba marina]
MDILPTFSDVVKSSLSDLFNDVISCDKCYQIINKSAIDHEFDILQIFRQILYSSNDFKTFSHFNELCDMFHFFPQILTLTFDENDFTNIKNGILHMVLTDYISVLTFQDFVTSKISNNTSLFENLMVDILKNDDFDICKRLDLFEFIFSYAKSKISTDVIKLLLSVLPKLNDRERLYVITTKCIFHIVKIREGKDYVFNDKELSLQVFKRLLVKHVHTQSTMKEMKVFSEIAYHFNSYTRYNIYTTYQKEHIIPYMETFTNNKDLMHVIELLKKDKEKDARTPISNALDQFPFIFVTKIFEEVLVMDKQSKLLLKYLNLFPSIVKDYALFLFIQQVSTEEKILAQAKNLILLFTKQSDKHFLTSLLEFLIECTDTKPFLAIDMFGKLFKQLNYNYENGDKNTDHVQSFFTVMRNTQNLFKIPYYLTQLKCYFNRLKYSNFGNYDAVSKIIIDYFHFISSIVDVDEIKNYCENNAEELRCFFEIEDINTFWEICSWKSLSIITNANNKKHKFYSSSQIAMEIGKREQDLLHVIFWLLDLDDIVEPSKFYDSEIQKQKDNEDRGTKPRKADFLKYLERDKTFHITHYRTILSNLQSAFKTHRKLFFKPLFFIQQCISPRVVNSCKDALYCAKFVLYLFDNNIPAISINFKCCIVHEKKIFKKATLWDVKTKYQELCYGKFGFITNDKITYEQYDVAYKKWEKFINQQIYTFLFSKDESDIVKGLLIFQEMISVMNWSPDILHIVVYYETNGTSEIKSLCKKIPFPKPKGKFSFIHDISIHTLSIVNNSLSLPSIHYPQPVVKISESHQPKTTDSPSTIQQVLKDETAGDSSLTPNKNMEIEDVSHQNQSEINTQHDNNKDCCKKKIQEDKHVEDQSNEMEEVNKESQMEEIKEITPTKKIDEIQPENVKEVLKTEETVPMKEKDMEKQESENTQKQVIESPTPKSSKLKEKDEPPTQPNQEQKEIENEKSKEQHGQEPSSTNQKHNDLKSEKPRNSDDTKKINDYHNDPSSAYGSRQHRQNDRNPNYDDRRGGYRRDNYRRDDYGREDRRGGYRRDGDRRDGDRRDGDRRDGDRRDDYRRDDYRRDDYRRDDYRRDDYRRDDYRRDGDRREGNKFNDTRRRESFTDNGRKSSLSGQRPKHD